MYSVDHAHSPYGNGVNENLEIGNKLSIGARDLTGLRIGRLVVEGKVVHKGRYKWQCACDCGRKTWVLAQNVVSGRTKSCGCLIKEITAARSANAISRLPEYQIWRSVIRRARAGISVDPDWLRSFDSFIEDVGRRPSDRHRFTRRKFAEGFNKENCVWKVAR